MKLINTLTVFCGLFSTLLLTSAFTSINKSFADTDLYVKQISSFNLCIGNQADFKVIVANLKPGPIIGKVRVDLNLTPPPNTQGNYRKFSAATITLNGTQSNNNGSLTFSFNNIKLEAPGYWTVEANVEAFIKETSYANNIKSKQMNISANKHCGIAVNTQNQYR